MRLKDPDQKYQCTHNALYSCYYHIVFCTKYRRAVLSGQMQEEFKALVKSKEKAYGFELIEAETMCDHVHLLLSVNPQYAVNAVIAKIKGFTAHELRKKYPELKSRLPSLWTRSKFVSSAGYVTLEILKTYIKNQKGV